MDQNSYQGNCVSCGITIINVSHSPGERVHSCSTCGSVLRYEPVPLPMDGLWEEPTKTRS